MSQQLKGAALLLVLMVAGSSGRTVSGMATAEPVRPMPAVGDCQTTGAAAVQTEGPLVSPVLLPCTGPRIGEVMMVFEDFPASQALTFRDLSPAAQCHLHMRDYLGVRSDEGQPDSWSTSTGLTMTAFVGPDARQRAAGQRWAACLIYVSSAVNGQAGFLGPARDIMQRPGPDSAVVSSCSNKPAQQTASCLAPHRGESIGTEQVEPGTPPSAVQASCEQLVRDMTLMPDPTAGGELTVSGTILLPLADDPDDVLTAECEVTVTDPARALTSTLRNLGSAALPMA